MGASLTSGITLPSSADRMPDDDPDKLKGPGGLTLRQIHEQVRKSVERDNEAAKARNALAHRPSRWQRFVRYVWDRKGR